MGEVPRITITWYLLTYLFVLYLLSLLSEIVGQTK